MSALTALDDELYMGGEHHGNLFVLRRNTETENELERQQLQTVGEYHVGDVVNVICHGSLVMAAVGANGAVSAPSSMATDDAPADADADASMAGDADSAPLDMAKVLASASARLPTVLYGTVGGAIGVSATLPPSVFRALLRIENAMVQVVHGVGGLEHADFRKFRNEAREAHKAGFIDGDLVETYLELPPAQQTQVAEAASLERADITRLLEILVQATHG